MPVRRIEITVSEDTWARLNDARGHEPRASFVKRALEQALSAGERVEADRMPSVARPVSAPVRASVDGSGDLWGKCPKATCSAAGPVGQGCPLHPNLRFKVLS